MELCGWRTRAMFDRYNIIDEVDLAAGGEEVGANDTSTRVDPFYGIHPRAKLRRSNTRPWRNW
jgi:hypothetical protein